jgi:hypothetical protein
LAALGGGRESDLFGAFPIRHYQVIRHCLSSSKGSWWAEAESKPGPYS